MILRTFLSVLLTTLSAGYSVLAQSGDPITNPALITPAELVPGTIHPIDFTSDTTSENVQILGSWLLSSQNGNGAVQGYSDEAGTYALLAQPDIGLVIFDTSDRSQPRLHAVFSRAGEMMNSVAVFGQFALCAQKAGPFLVVDLADPGAPVLTAEYSATFTSAHDVILADTLAVVLSSSTSEFPAGAHLLDLSDPAAPRQVAAIIGRDFRSAAFADGILWLSVSGADSVLAYDLRGLPAVQPVGGFGFPAPAALTMNAQGTDLFVASDSTDAGIGIFALTGPGTAEHLSSVDGNHISAVHALFARQSLLFTSGKNNLVQVIDVTRPEEPWLAGIFSENTSPATTAMVRADDEPGDGGVSVYVEPDGRTLYVSDAGKGLLIFAYDEPEFRIHSVRTDEVDYTTALIYWRTTLPATGSVEVQTESGETVAIVRAPQRARQQRVLVTGLEPGTTYRYFVFAESVRGELTQSEAFSLTTPMFAGEIIRLNAGGPGLVFGDTLWSADQEFSQGGFGYDGGSALSSADDVTGGPRPELFRTARAGMDSYHFSLRSNGRYRVTLYFAEIEGLAAGTRVFDVLLEDSLAFEAVDIASAVGTGRALSRSAGVDIADGRLDLVFVARAGTPLVSAIEIVQVLPDRKAPDITNLSIDSLGTDRAVISWTTDEFASTFVEYGPEGSYGSLVSGTLGGGPFRYRAVLDSLQPETRYTFRVTARDSLGNERVRDGGFFQTALTTALSFVDITSSAGTGGPTYFRKTGGHSANFTDVNGDTRPDLYITMLRDDPMNDLFFRNIDGRTFASEAELRGIEDFDGGSHGAVFADLDNDGDFDLFNGATDSTATVSGRNNVYLNDGDGFFTDMSDSLGVADRSWETRGVAAFDMDNDDDLDLIAVTNYLGTDDPPGERNELYRNDLSPQGVLSFTSIDTGVVVEAPLAQGVTDADFDGDGDIDLLVANRTGPMNILRNEGGGVFSLLDPAELGIVHKAEDGITAGDIDNDGDLDLLLATDNYGHLYRNDGGRYTFLRSFEETDGYMAVFADMDNDSDLDIIFAGDDLIWLNAGGGYFVPGPATQVGAVNDPRAIATADIDGDGDLDFAVANKRSPNVLIRNELNTGNYLKVRLISASGQAGAFGAKVFVYPQGQAGSPGASLLGFREVHGINGYLGQDDPVQHFGLGSHDRVDVRVVFIDGSQALRRGVAANQTILINGPDADTAAPIISRVRAENITAQSAVLRWHTNEPARARLFFTDALGKQVSITDDALRREHSLRLVNLQPETPYSITISSEDELGNSRSIEGVRFTTSRAPEPVPQYDVFELGFQSRYMPENPAAQPPVLELEFTGTSGDALGQSFTVSGFWNGTDSMLVRFAPTAQGEWRWQSRSDLADLDGLQGFFLCSGTLPEEHISRRGFVRENPQAPYSFMHDDGTPFFLLGDTQWSFSTSAITWPDEFQAYVAARARQGFNYVHGVVYQTFPDGNDRNEGGQTFFNNDPDSLNPAFWAAFDRRVEWLNSRGLVAGLMLAWASDGWQDFRTREQVERYIRYVAARYAAYNVIWILAGEIEEAEIPGGYANAASVLRQADPYGHPLTTHTILSSADSQENRAWQSVIYQQTGETSLISRDRIYSKPVINSEFGYEGNIPPDAVRKRAWEIVMRGGFFVYGNKKTYHYQAEMTPENLDSPGALFMQYLGDFWKGSGDLRPRWWSFSRFDSLGPGRFTAGIPGEEEVIYLDDPAPLILSVADSIPLARITWFDTRTGERRNEERYPANGSLVLTPPDSGWAAWVNFRDDVPPEFGEVFLDMIDGFTVRARWTTSEPARSFVRFGRDSTCTNAVPSDSVYTTEHAVLLQGLEQGSSYHMCLSVVDFAGNRSEKKLMFRTIISDSAAWFFRDVRVDSITASSALFLWKTPVPMTSAIALGTDSTDLQTVLRSEVLKSEHSFRIDNLADSTRFFFRLSGVDSAGVTSVSSPGQFRTLFDRTPPELSSVSVQPVSPDSVLMVFSSSEQASSRLFFREVSEVQDRELAIDNLVREHRYYLDSIRSKTRYRYVITLRDKRGNEFTSEPAYFSTDSLASQPFSLVLQAETMPERTRGTAAENNSSWYFGSEGSLAAPVAIPANGLHRVTVRAKGQNADPDGWPALQLALDGAVVQHISVASNSYETVTMLVRLRAGESEFRLKNLPRGRNSRYGEVWIDWMKIESLDAAPVPVAPLVFDVAVLEEAGSQARVRWQTNVPTWTQVRYGLSSHKTEAVADDSLAFVHEIRLTELLADTLYTLQITAVDSLGYSTDQQIALRTSALTTAVPEDGLPQSFRVSRNFPNPFNAGTRIRVDLPEAGELEIAIFDTAGRQVAVLNSGTVAPGRLEYTWPARGATLSRYSSGIYFLKVIYQNDTLREIVTRRLVLLK